MLKQIYKDYKDTILLAMVAAMIGVGVASIDVLFGKVLDWLGVFRDGHINLLLPFFPFAGLIIVYIYANVGRDCTKGMGLIFSAGFGDRDKIPKRLIPLAIISTWMTHLFGGSAGREGVAIQIGGTFGHSVGRKLHIKNCSEILLVSGMAAGFSGLFLTPLAAIFFALEVFVVGSFEYIALFPTIVAAFSAYYTSKTLGLSQFSVDLAVPTEANYVVLLKLVLIGILFGIVGALFAYAFSTMKIFLGLKLKNPFVRIFVVGTIISILVFVLHDGRYSGLGGNIITACFSGGEIYSYDWIIKCMLTIMTLSAGFQGGEVTTLFTMGSSLGVIVAPLFGLPIELTAALGYAAVFGSATNTILAPIFIGVEVFGYEYLPYFFLVCSISYVFNANKSIYAMQRKSYLFQ
ncbi:MAG: chloride channel protein [bacterium]|nr:chloride channel protein [bacterium]